MLIIEQRMSEINLMPCTGKEMVDYITEYLSSIRDRRVIPDVKPGDTQKLLPDSAPTEPEDWESIFNDIERVIMPGVSFLLSLFLIKGVHFFSFLNS